NYDYDYTLVYQNMLYARMYLGANKTNAVLVITDGTQSGTSIQTNGPTFDALNWNNFTVYNNQVYYSGATSARGVEVFSTGATPADICAGACSSTPRGLVVMNSKLYFTAQS